MAWPENECCKQTRDTIQRFRKTRVRLDRFRRDYILPASHSLPESNRDGA